MTDTSDDATVRRATICSRCGALLLSGQTCSLCGPQAPPAEDDLLSIVIKLSVLICDQCQAVMDRGAVACPVCGEPAEQIDVRRAALTRVKWSALGDLLPEFQKLAAVPLAAGEQNLPLTEEQLFNYLKNNRIISSDILTALKPLTRQLNITSRSTASSLQTRRAFGGLLAEMGKARQVYDELARIQVPERLQALRTQLLAIFHGILDLGLAIGHTVLSGTLEEAGTYGRAMQVSLDRAAEAAALASIELGLIDPASVSNGDINQRLRLFSRHQGQYEYAQQPDFAALIATAIERDGSIAELGRIGYDYFSGMLTIDPAQIGETQALELYVLASEVAVWDDPLILRRRANIVLSLLDEAFQCDSTPMVEALPHAESDMEDATVVLLSLLDQIRAVQTATRANALPREAERLILCQMYLSLVEAVFPRLVNLLLVAKSVLTYSLILYPDLAMMSLGDKYAAMLQAGDPRYSVVLSAISMVARNAIAHGRFDLSGDKIQFVQKDQERKVKTEEFTDEHFGMRSKDLLATCLALRLALSLFRIQHHMIFPPALPPTKPRVVLETARAVMGKAGLHQVQVSFNRPDALVFEATPITDPAAEASGYLPYVVLLATLFSESVARIELRIRTVDGSGYAYTLKVLSTEMHALSRLPDFAKDFGWIRLAYTTEIHPSSAPLITRYEQEWLLRCAKLILDDLKRVVALYQQLPATRKVYEHNMRLVIKKSSYLHQMLGQVPAPKGASKSRDLLLHCLETLEADVLMQAQLPDQLTRTLPMLSEVFDALDGPKEA